MRVGKPTQRGPLRKLGFAALGLVIAAGPQLAALAAIRRYFLREFGLAGLHWFAPLAAALVALNVALALEYARTFRDREVPRSLRLALFYPFYVWWFGSTVFAVLGGLAQLLTLPFVLNGAMAPLTGPVEVALVIVAYLLGAYGVFAGQTSLRPEHIDTPLPGLPRGWVGARIVQISDIHAGRYIGDNRVQQLADAAAAAQPDLVVITGDLVNDSPAFALDAARALASIPTRLGVFACLGNHDYYAGAELVADAFQQVGIKLLRNDGCVVERDGDGLWLAGVDEAWFHRTDLPDALRERPDGMTTILLSHHPELFPEAARAEVHLQLSGHTHGGQIGFIRLHPSLSLYRLISPFVAGLYRLGDALLYVNRGAGAVQPLIRLGAPPEVTVLTLREGQTAEARALEYRGAFDEDEDEEPLAEVA